MSISDKISKLGQLLADTAAELDDLAAMVGLERMQPEPAPMPQAKPVRRAAKKAAGGGGVRRGRPKGTTKAAKAAAAEAAEA